MTPRFDRNDALKIVAAFTLFFASTLLLADQKKTAPPPKAAAPAPAAKTAAAPVRPGATAQRSGQPQAQTRAGQPATAQRPGQPPANGANRTATTGAGAGSRNATTGRPGATSNNLAASRTPTKTPTSTATKTPSATPSKTAAPPAGVARTTAGPNGSTRGFDKRGNLTHVTTANGAEAHLAPNGRVTTIKTASGATITHARTGPPSVVGERVSPGGVHYRVVNTGRERGYVARDFSRGGRAYERRTYVVGGRTYVSVYRGYGYRGHVYYGYVPAYYYHPAYYGWAYAPYAAPVPYAWGWAGSPWYGAYGYYWTPYPVYASPAFWLTDYLVAQNLQAAYEARAAAAADASAAQSQGDASQQLVASDGPTPLSPETKQMIADEVKAQLAAEQAAAAAQNTAAPAGGGPVPDANVNQAPPALDPTLKIFIVSSSLDVAATGQSCALSPGDILMRMEDSPGDDDMVGVKVVSSQTSDCVGGSSQRVQVADLQEMHNHFREQMDGGLKILAEKQGKNGIPAAPAGSGRNNPEGVAAEDLNVSADLRKQQDEADQAEKDVQQASATSGSAGGDN